MLSSYSFALASALLWAVSAPILNIGLERIPKDAKVPGILTGLFISLVAGSLSLLLIVADNLEAVRISRHLVLAGVFTFPVATGLYYLCGNAFEGKTEIAAQFARVKPIFSVLFAVFLLKEKLSWLSYSSLLLVSIGLGFLIMGGLQGVFRSVALLLGVLTALAWALGEVFMKIGLTGKLSIIDTFVALLSGTIVGSVFILPWTFSLIRRRVGLASWLAPFAAHGLLSFGLAYSAFFESIKRIGLGRTVLINAFWPILAVFLVCLCSRLRKQECHVPKNVWLAAPFLVMGSIVQVVVFL